LPRDAESFSAEWALLLECAKPEPDSRRLSQCLAVPLRWPALIGLADDHGTLALTATRLLNHSEAAVPPDSLEQIRTRRRSQALFTLNLTAEMFRLFSSFGNAKLPALVIKGPVLSQRCYADAGLRQYGDLDLIVRDRDILRTTELMIELGYQPRIPVSAIQSKKIPGEYVFRHSRSKLLVELHTELTFRYHPRPLPIERLFSRQVHVDFDGTAIPALSLEDELVLISIHGAKHFWERLIYIADVAAFLTRQQLDWDRLFSAAAEVAAQRMLRSALGLAASLLDAPLPPEINAAVRNDAAVSRLTAQITRWLPPAGSAPPGLFERAVFRMRMRGSMLSAIPYLLRLSISPTEDDWAASGETHRHWFLDALGRPFRLARKYGRDGKPDSSAGQS
jgi:Uncharacterised nucleotidyltransferase